MENLKIYIDRLKNGQTQKIEETLSPNFLDIHEKELSFKDPVFLQASAYLTDDYLIIQFNVQTSFWMPCAICNEIISIPLLIKNFTCTHSLAEIKGAIFDLVEKVREVILLQVPLTTECNCGNCPERKNLKNFLNSGKKWDEPKEASHFPFADL